MSIFSSAQSSSDDDDDSFTLTLLTGQIVQVISCFLKVRRNKRRRVRKPRRARSTYFFQNRVSLEDFLQLNSESSFYSSFRMSVHSFSQLVQILQPKLEKDQYMASIGSAGPISAGVRVLILLRLLAGSSARDLCYIFKIALPTVYCSFHETCDAILSALPLPGISSDPRELRENALGFLLSRSLNNHSRPCNPLPGCVAAIDGLTVDIVLPRVNNAKDYKNRYSNTSFPVVACVGANYQFYTFSAIATGSTHDSTAYRMSNVGSFVENGGLPAGFWIAGDDAYGASESMICPFPGSSLDVWRDSVNYFQSSLRVHVEQAFGYLRSRWCILQSALKFGLSRSIRIVCVAMILHNYCNERRDWWERRMDWTTLPTETIDMAKSELDEWLAESNSAMELSLRADATVRSRTRDRLVNCVKRKGVLRPVV